MAEFAPTPSQKQAIENRGGALLVSAAAGSGKTRVLTERLTGRISDPQDPRDIDSFLVITYTRAAAAELRGRITDELSALLSADPTDRRLRRQNALLQRAQIGTIHSFCTTLLREYCHLCGLTPDFAVADEDRARALRDAALRRVMDSAYQKGDAEFLLLSDTVGAGRDDARLTALVLSLYDKLQSHARPEEWARAQSEALSAHHEDAAETLWGRELLSRARETALYWAGELDALLALMGNYDYIQKAYGPSVGESADALRAFAALCNVGWDAARAALPIPFPRLGGLRSPADPEVTEQIKARRESCKKAAARLETSLPAASAELLRDMERTAPAMRALLSLVGEFDAAFTAEKRRKSLVDFSDLEHIAARLLTNADGSPTEVAAQVSQRFTEVMVDEYQDVSRVQDLIIRAVSDNGRKLFMVGDVKQSIYRFRLADPGIFIEKYLTYAPAETAAPGEPRRVLLRENFRSRPEVLHAVNAVFRSLMSRSLGEIDYDDDAALRPGLPCQGDVPLPEMLAVTLPDAEDGDEERPDKAAVEAAFVAEKINELVRSGALITDRGEQRRVGYGDIAILLRSANVAGGVYRRELTRAGIPVLSDGGGGFFSSPMVTVLRSLLAVIDNPRQDVPLISALRSPLFCFTADELSRIRAASPDTDFYDAVTAAAGSDPKCADFLKTLLALRAAAPDMELGALLREIYTTLDCMALCCAAPGGRAERDNLMLLYSLAARFEKSGWRGLHRFLTWLSSMDERGEEPRVGSEDAHGAVRIMSVHKSKGLEFPVVFLCDTARRFNKSDARAAVLVHPVLGLGPKLTDAARGIEYPTLARRAIAARMERETLSEELRLLYVALTRARERLFVTCILPDPQRTIGDISRSVTSPMAAEALSAMACPAQWMIAAALAGGEQQLRLTVAAAAGKPERQGNFTPADRALPPGEDEELAARLDWEYPFARAVSLPSKITATELKSLPHADEESAALLPRAKGVFRRAEFVRDSGRLNAAERGTAAHAALRYLDLTKTGSQAELQGELTRLTYAGYLTPREAKSVDAATLAGLFASPIGQRILAADEVKREFPFTLLCRADSLFPGAGEEEILLQGVIDCCIREGDTLTLLDYKTDGVSADTAPRRAERYRGQLEAYAMAMERITGLPVREKILCFLHCGAIIPL